MTSTTGTAPPPAGKKPAPPRFAAIPNILQGKALCAVIKKWQEGQQQAAKKGINCTPGMNWEDISRELNRTGSAADNLTPAACQILWRYLAYGQIVTEEDLRAGTISSYTGTATSSAPVTQNSKKNLVFPAPPPAATAVLPKKKKPAPAPAKKPAAKKPNEPPPPPTKKRPGTIYVSCVHCQKEVSHSNIAAHIRKAHPELAKEKRERNRKPRPAAPTPSTTTMTVIASGAAIAVPPPSQSAPDKNGPQKQGGKGCRRSVCPHCKGDFSRSHLSKHIKKQHPVEAAMESLLRRVEFEAEYFQSSLTTAPPPALTAMKPPSLSHPALAAMKPPSLATTTVDSSADAVHFTKKSKTNDGVIVTAVDEGSKDKVTCSGNESFEEADRTETEEQRRSRKRRESVTATCKYCNVTITKKHMIVHIRKLHPEKLFLMAEGGGVKSAEPQTSSRERSDKFPTVACNYCGKEITKKSIRAHVRNLHPEVVDESEASGVNGSKPYTVSCPTTQCKYCGKIITKKSIRAHVRNLHPEAAVEEVLAAASKAGDKSRSGSSPLFGVPNGEVKSVKGNSGTVSCHYCHMRFPPADIPNHIRYSHERTVTTLCKYCPKQIQNRNMNTHVRKYHVVESVLEVLVGKVASLNETQPAVLNCTLPGSRLHAINALSSAAGSKSAPALPFSTQRELDERDALQQKELEDAGATQPSLSNYHSGSYEYDVKSSIGEIVSTAASKRILPSSGVSAAKKRMKSGSGSTTATLVQADPSGTDFSNLHLLAAFASTLQPIIL